MKAPEGQTARISLTGQHGRPLHDEDTMSSTNKKSQVMRATPVFRQSNKPPVAPPIYHPPAMPSAAQPRMANNVVARKQPIAPPVYRPQPTQKVLQKKSSSAQNPQMDRAPRQTVAPPVYRPEAKQMIQPKTVSQTNRLIASPGKGTVAKRTALQTRLVPPPAIVQKQPRARNVMQLYRKFADAPGEGGAFKTIAGEVDGVKYHVRIDRDSLQYQQHSFVSTTLFSSLHVVIEDDEFRDYYPHYYYDDDGTFVRRDNQNLDKGHYRRLADAVVNDLIKSKGYPEALSQEEVNAIRLAEAEGVVKLEGKKVENKRKADDNRELHVEGLFLKEQTRRKKLKLNPLTLIDYNGAKFRGKYMMSPVELLPVGKDEQ